MKTGKNRLNIYVFKVYKPTNILYVMWQLQKICIIYLQKDTAKAKFYLLNLIQSNA